MKPLLIILLFFISLTSWAKEQPIAYSTEISKNFVESCISANGQEDNCNCAIREMPNYLSEKEFIELEKNYVKTGEIPQKMLDAMTSVMATCNK